MPKLSPLMPSQVLLTINWDRLNIKTPYHQHMDLRYKDKTLSRSSYIYNGITIPELMVNNHLSPVYPTTFGKSISIYEFVCTLDRMKIFFLYVNIYWYIYILQTKHHNLFYIIFIFQITLTLTWVHLIPFPIDWLIMYRSPSYQNMNSYHPDNTIP